MITDKLKESLPSDATSVNLHEFHLLKEQGLSSTMYSFFLTYVSGGIRCKKDLILRIYKRGCEVNGNKEFAVLKALKEHNIPVPTVYCFETDDRVFGESYMVMERIGGKPASAFLNDGANAGAMVGKMAEALVKVHQLDPDCINVSHFLREQYEFRQSDLLKIEFFIKKSSMIFFSFAQARQRRFVAALKRLEEAELKSYRPCLLHMEYEPNHVLVSNGRCVIVDWGEALVGNPAFDVAWTYHELRLGRENSKVDLGEYFVKCYEEYAGQRLVNLQFFKDLAAQRLASWYQLSPFRPNIFMVFRKLVSMTFGDLFGRILGTMYMCKQQREIEKYHTIAKRSIEYLQSYALRYLERDRYN